MRRLSTKFLIALGAVGAIFGASAAVAQGQPAQWRYSIPPGEISTATYPGNVDIKGQLITNGTIANYATVAEMAAAIIPASVQAVETAGYTTPGDGGGAIYVKDVAAGTCVVQSADGQYWRLNNAPAMSIMQCGAIPGDGVDDAAIIQAVANDADFPNIIIPAGTFEVSTMTWSSNSKTFNFLKGSKFYGISPVPVDALLRLHNFRNNRLTNVTLETDGAAVTPVFVTNYGTAMQWTSDNGSSPTQFVWFDGVNIRYFKAGITNGALLGSPPQASFPQSEIFLKDFYLRGVMQAYYSNAINSYVTSSSSIYLTQQFEANSSWWDNAQAFNVRTDEGDFVSVGDEYQSARTTGWNIYGKGMRIVAPVWEHSCPNFITGNVSISDMTNGYFGSNVNPAFQVDPAAIGQLNLNNINIRRPDGTASSSGAVFIDAKGNNNYRILLTNSRLKEWPIRIVSANAHFVLGGKLNARALTLDNSASTQPSWYLNFNQVPAGRWDPTGFTMSTTPDFAAKGGWTGTGAPAGASFNKYTANLPTGFNSAILFTTTGTSATVTTATGSSGQQVFGGKDYVLKMQLKAIGATVTSFAINVIWYDYTGTIISTTNGYSADLARMTSMGFNQWQELRVPAASPSNAVFAAAQVVSGSTSSVAITGVYFE